MPQSRRYKKKKSAGKAILAWIIVLAILAAAVFVFVSVFYEDTKKKLDEMNYPRTYSTYVEKAAKDYDLDPALIYAVIHTESFFTVKSWNFCPRTKSSLAITADALIPYRSNAARTLSAPSPIP